MACPILSSGCDLSVGFGELFGQIFGWKPLWGNVWGLRLNGGRAGQVSKGGGAVSPWERRLGRNRFEAEEWVPCCCLWLLGVEGRSVFLCGTPGTSSLARFVGVIELLQKAVTVEEIDPLQVLWVFLY